MGAANSVWASGSTGRCRRVVNAGYSASELPFFQSVLGLMGLGQKPPPQLGQTLDSSVSTQLRQKVHSNEQIIASGEAGGSELSQFSQLGLSSNIARSLA